VLPKGSALTKRGVIFPIYVRANNAGHLDHHVVLTENRTTGESRSTDQEVDLRAKTQQYACARSQHS
jgi:hypothetical protein